MLNKKYRQMVNDCDKHNLSIRKEVKRKSKEKIGASLEREAHTIGSTSNVRNTCFIGFKYKPGQYNKIFNKSNK